MTPRFGRSLAASLVLSLLLPAAVSAAGPIIERGGAVEERYFDDFLLELCGIETYTTVTERWSFKEFRDGSTQLHVVRTFVPDHPGVPIEKGTGTRFTSPDGSERVAGKPIQLFGRDGGVLLLGAGLTLFGTEVTVRGLNALDVDLADYYCP